MSVFEITSGTDSTLVSVNGKKAYYTSGQMQNYTPDGSGLDVYLYDSTGKFGSERLRMIIGTDTIIVNGVTSFANADALMSALAPVFFFSSLDFAGEFTSYTDLTNQLSPGNAGRFAFVLNSQGTKWLPGSIGGTYYNAGWYYDTGSAWANKNDEILEGLEKTTLKNQIRVDQNNFASVFGGSIDPTKEYFIDGVIDVGNMPITVPPGGLLIKGFAFDKSKLFSSEDNFTLFQGASAGDLFLRSLSVEITGTNSKVFELVSNTGFEAVELTEVNFESCSSLGSLNAYRQGLELNTGRFGGTPELEFIGTWVGGYRIDSSIALGMGDFTALFKAGSGFTFGGRFIVNINCDLPAIGALCDFSPSNIIENESLRFEGAFIRRQGIVNFKDAGLVPNITERDQKSFWSDNVGLADTQKFYRHVITTEIETVINTAGTYEVLAGTWTGDAEPSHFDSPVNGQIRLLSGGGKFQIFGDISVQGGANETVDIRITKSEDDGATWPTVVNHIRRQINSFVGPRNVGFFPIAFLTSLAEGDRIRLEVENVADTTNVTAEIDSTLIVTQV